MRHSRLNALHTRRRIFEARGPTQWGMSEDLEGSLREFAIAEEVIPRSSWLHYFKGLCYYHYEMKDEALASLRRSLESDALSLTRPKREIAESLVNRLSKIGG